MVNPQLIQQHLQDRVEDLALHRSLYPDLSDEDWRFFLQQVEGYQRTRDKLPSLTHWWFPPRISCEQCSSEATAKYKAELISGHHLIDLTGGAGVDTYFLSDKFDTVDYVEQNEELCHLAQHNLPPRVSIHNCSAEHYLERLPLEGKPTEGVCIFTDPARRDKNGGKVFRLADCTPNVVELLPKMQEVADTILIKLSPMLDISQALRELGGHWDVHIVSVKNEVKEVLLLDEKARGREGEKAKITAVDVAEGWKFEFTREEETIAECRMHNAPFTNLQTNQFKNSFLYEPCAAILKAGAYKLVGTRYGLEKLGVNTHLYVSDRFITNFPGRCWKILGEVAKGLNGEKANVLTRNYPLSAEQLKKKLHVKDGGDQFIIGTRIGDKPVVLSAERI